MYIYCSICCVLYVECTLHVSYIVYSRITIYCILYTEYTHTYIHYIYHILDNKQYWKWFVQLNYTTQYWSYGMILSPTNYSNNSLSAILRDWLSYLLFWSLYQENRSWRRAEPYNRSSRVRGVHSGFVSPRSIIISLVIITLVTDYRYYRQWITKDGSS